MILPPIHKLYATAARIVVHTVIQAAHASFRRSIVVTHQLCGKVTCGSVFGLNVGDTFSGTVSYNTANLIVHDPEDIVFLGSFVSFYTPLLNLSLALGNQSFVEADDFQFNQLPYALFDEKEQFCGIDFVVDDDRSLLVLRDGCHPDNMTGVDKVADTYFEAQVTYELRSVTPSCESECPFQLPGDIAA